MQKETPDTFLHLVAKDMLCRFGIDMKDVTVVFPGKRAGIFFNQELAKCSKVPVWTPRYVIMSDLFRQLSTLQTADSIDSICTLYQIYQEVMMRNGEEAESLDQFWGWAEVILSDFDDLDKHMADAKSVFSNVYDLQQLDSLDYLTEEQAETLKNFFQHFSLEGNSILKERFLRIWSRMYEIYSQLKELLIADGTLYEGALFRRVAEEIKKESAILEHFLEKKKMVVFVGFNVLNEVEKVLMNAIQRTGKALFYWDYDIKYIDDASQEAGIFMRQNLKEFPNALPRENFDNLKHLQDVTFISCNSDNAAAKYVNTWIKNGDIKSANHNAVILCNEALLQPVIHSFSEEVGNANITMGFPFTDTPIYSLLISLFKMQTDGYDKTRKRFLYPFIQNINHHVYCEWLPEDWQTYHGENIKELLGYLIRITEQVGMHYAEIANPNVYEQLYIEGTFHAHRILQKFYQLSSRSERPLQLQPNTLRRLLKDVLRRFSIPFHGEPASGLQIMGVLETRCLDFTNMLMLSVEEGMLPKNLQATSMIPANIREAFGMTTLRHQMAIYAYYFYRLIQRTQHLTCLFNENCVGNNRHEPSRFLRQMLAETSIPIRTLWLKSIPDVETTPEWKVQKTDEVIAHLRKIYDQSYPHGQKRTLSPSAINIFMQCPFRFYMQCVAGLRAEDNPTEGLEASHIGDIFHDTAMLIYEQIINRTGSNEIQASTLGEILANMKKHVEPLLDIVFDAIYFHPQDKWKRSEIISEQAKKGYKPKDNVYTGELIIIRRVIMQYLTNLLRYDMKHAPFKILGMEVDRKFEMTVTPENQPPVTIRTGGRIDRLDEMGGRRRIVDYKTGNHVVKGVKDMSEVISPGKNHQGYFLQTFLYAQAERLQENPTLPIKPVLFFVSHAFAEEYEPDLTLANENIDDFKGEIAKEFMDGMEQIISNIFDPNQPFHQAEETQMCGHCDLRLICGRE